MDSGGMDTLNIPVPTRIVVHQKSKLLEVEFNTGACFKFPFEFLRVYSPSAEVRGHGVGQEILQVGKKEVGIAQLKQVGLYAIQPVFSDGHESGIFSWQYLLWMGENQSSLWQDYLDRIKSAGASRESDVQDKVVVAQKKGACSGH